jgi:lysozyme
MSKTSSSKRGVGFGLLTVLLAAPLVSFFEGTVLTTYQDPVGIPTACIGETNREVVMRKVFTKDECTALLGASLMEHMNHVAQCVNVPVKPNEAAAVLSWSYNVGVEAACKSSLMAKLNAGAPAPEWCFELKKWVYAKGKRLNGLVNRREAEYKMCTTGEWK